MPVTKATPNQKTVSGANEVSPIHRLSVAAFASALTIEPLYRGPKVTVMAQKSSDVYDYYFENYLILYNLYGRGRPKVDREHYEELDAELMKIIRKGDHDELCRSEIIRVRDIEFMLLDDIAEALLDKPSTR